MNTKIEYVDFSWSPVTGCSPEFSCWSYCWARKMSLRLHGRCGYDFDDPFRPTFHPGRLDQPARLERPRRIAVCFMGDLWADGVNPADRAAVIRATDAATQHTYLFLTKRIARAADEIDWTASPHRWIGTSVEDQATADERTPHLCRCKARRRWLSIEPMRGPIVLPVGDDVERAERVETGLRGSGIGQGGTSINWVVLGGESGCGRDVRPMHPNWVRSIRDQCGQAGVPFFFKQWGEWWPIHGTGLTRDTDAHAAAGPSPVPFCWLAENGKRHASGCEPSVLMLRVGKKEAGRELDGREWGEVPTRTAEEFSAGGVL